MKQKLELFKWILNPKFKGEEKSIQFEGLRERGE